jgi:hypothetical protein
MARTKASVKASARLVPTYRHTQRLIKEEAERVQEIVHREVIRDQGLARLLGRVARILGDPVSIIIKMWKESIDLARTIPRGIYFPPQAIESGVVLD